MCFAEIALNEELLATCAQKKTFRKPSETLQSSCRLGLLNVLITD